MVTSVGEDSPWGTLGKAPGEIEFKPKDHSLNII